MVVRVKKQIANGAIGIKQRAENNIGINNNFQNYLLGFFERLFFFTKETNSFKSVFFAFDFRASSIYCK